MIVESFAEGSWVKGSGSGRELFHAVTGEKFGEIANQDLDYKGMLNYARTVGGPKLRAMTFHERAIMLKELAIYLDTRKEEFYEISKATGATRTDSWIDIEGGFGTFFVYSGKGRRDFPNSTVYVDGPTEPLSKEGTFVGQHICVPMEGAALHINAFNFPVWGMLEKLAPTFIGGMPAIVKPASITCYLTEAVVRAMLDSKILPEGALQLICGGVGDMFEHLNEQDVVTFTGSAETGKSLRSHKNIIDNSIRFNMEADSLNCSILGCDATPDTEEFDLFIKEVAREMTVKAGQKCTAIRRTIVPENLVEDVTKALSARLGKATLGNPDVEGVRMGPLAGQSQVEEVRARVNELKECCELVYGDPENFDVVGGEVGKGAYFPASLLYCKDPLRQSIPHDVEPFGPVNTIMPYKTNAEAVELARLGKGSLVGSLFTADNSIAREIVLGTAPYHGRIVVLNKDCAKESTGHGSPLPHLVHGGPGRAGGGEEMGGARGVMHFMQRTAIQGSPTTITTICDQWITGAERNELETHPFRKYFEELNIGDSLTTHRRTITEADIVNFANLSGDHFYAHVDKIAAKDSIFERGERVAHGYFIISAAAGLFVDPGYGPVLANYGMENLRFTEPVYIGDTIQVKLTVKEKVYKAKKEDQVPQGVVYWDVEVTNQDDVVVATYTILTLVRRKEED